MTATIPPKQSGLLPTLVQLPVPTLPGGAAVYTQQQVVNLTAVINELLIMCPQSATRAPQRLKDGMKRLARNPWWPVAGQVKDEWVYWDAAGQVWRYFIAEPTTT